MFSATHIDEVWPQMVKQAMSGTRIHGTQGQLEGEILGCHLVLDGAAEQFCLNPRRRLSPVYASAELLWYLSRQPSGDMIKAYAPKYERYLESNGQAYGAYGARLAENLSTTTDGVADEDLLEVAVQLLTDNLTTKKAVVSLWRPCDLLHTGHTDGWYKRNDLPCTIAWQFIRRDDKVNMFCYMRSCDLWIGCLFDCYVNTVIQRYVAASVGCTAGEYHHIAGSMHLYERNMKAAKEVIEQDDYWRDAPSIGAHWPPHLLAERWYPGHQDSIWTDGELAVALQCEKAVRLPREHNFSAGFMPTVLKDAVLCCTKKWIDSATTDLIVSPGLRHAFCNSEVSNEERG